VLGANRQIFPKGSGMSKHATFRPTIPLPSHAPTPKSMRSASPESCASNRPHLNAMRVVNQPIEDAVGHGRVGTNAAERARATNQCFCNTL
jgi:hypothetical protein